MKINRTGITRIVIELQTVVVKIPNFTYSWQHLLKGLLANMQERTIWDTHKDDLLCPVVWMMRGGFVLVMKKADVKRHVDEVYHSAPIGDINPAEEVKKRYQKWIDYGFGGDDKCDNYGYYEDRLVKIDYGSY